MASRKKSKAVSAPPRTASPASPAPATPATSGGGSGAKVAGLLVLVLLAVAAYWWVGRGPAYVLTPSSDQNVLLITIDTLRGDALGSYGGQAATPNLDRLAGEGARFSFAHSHAVVTLPSHTSILTGHFPYEHGIRDNSGFRVKDGTVTLATRLKALGFATGAFVGGFPLTKRFGLTPGFDVYDDQIAELKGDITFTMPERSADAVVDRAVRWINDTPGKFFGWVHVFDAHAPYQPPAEFMTRYADSPYAGEVAWIDFALGPLLERLRTLSRPTVVIVTADHGESLGEHGEETHGMFAYEATLHVPLIVATVEPQGAGAGSTPTRGEVIDTPVRHIDIAPTVLEAVSAEADASLPGTSLSALIRDGSGPDRPSYFESMTYNLVRGWAPLRGVLVERMKHVDQPIPELYDLNADPKELNNLASSAPEQLQLLTNVLRTYNTAPPDRPGQENAETSAVLRSLGYVSGSAEARDVYTEADDLKNLVSIDRDLHRASELYQSGRVQEAIDLMTSVTERRPDTADAYISLAHAYYESGQVDAAIRTLESGLSHGAPDRDIRIRLGIYLSETGQDIPKAIALLEGLPDTDAEALNGLGVAYGAAGRYDDAIQAFSSILQLDPTNGLAAQNVAAMLLEQAEASPAQRAAKLAEAETWARRAISADPDLGKAYTTLGVILAYTNRNNEAINSWIQAVKLDPTEFQAMYNLTVKLVEVGRIGEARGYARQFVNTAPPAFFATEIAQLRTLLQ